MFLRSVDHGDLKLWLTEGMTESTPSVDEPKFLKSCHRYCKTGMAHLPTPVGHTAVKEDGDLYDRVDMEEVD